MKRNFNISSNGCHKPVIVEPGTEQNDRHRPIPQALCTKSMKITRNPYLSIGACYNSVTALHPTLANRLQTVELFVSV